MKLRLSSTSHTARGKRPNNEDAMYASDERGLYAVADGVGGLPNGAQASQLATQEVVLTASTGVTALGCSRRITRNAAKAIRDQSDSMGTTLTHALFDREGGVMHVGHAGDSRLYLLRRGDLRCVTTDQTYHGSLTGGLFSKGSSGAVALPQHTKLMMFKGDIVLLCTDGIHGSPWYGTYAPESIIYSAMKSHDAKQLVVNSIQMCGSKDNATAIIVRVS